MGTNPARTGNNVPRFDKPRTGTEYGGKLGVGYIPGRSRPALYERNGQSVVVLGYFYDASALKAFQRLMDELGSGRASEVA